MNENGIIELKWSDLQKLLFQLFSLAEYLEQWDN